MFLQISADFVTWFDKFLFQLKALQKRMQKDENRFTVPQAVPEIYRKNERLKTGGCVFLLSTVHIQTQKVSSKICKNNAKYIDDNGNHWKHLLQKATKYRPKYVAWMSMRNFDCKRKQKRLGNWRWIWIPPNGFQIEIKSSLLSCL